MEAAVKYGFWKGGQDGFDKLALTFSARDRSRSQWVSEFFHWLISMHVAAMSLHLEELCQNSKERSQNNTDSLGRTAHPHLETGQ